LEPSGIKFYREKKGLRQIDVANSLGTSEARMSRIERGEEIPNADEVDKLVALLGAPPPYLFSEHILGEIAERARRQGQAQVA
jgi:transcriptional regulator with XRE-family HTH domain